MRRRITDRGIMRERLPVGLIALIGKQGSGKTSSAVAMLSNDCKYHHLERFNESAVFYKELNKNGFNLHLPKNKTLYFSSEAIVLNKSLECKLGTSTHKSLNCQTLMKRSSTFLAAA